MKRETIGVSNHITFTECFHDLGKMASEWHQNGIKILGRGDMPPDPPLTLHAKPKFDAFHPVKSVTNYVLTPGKVSATCYYLELYTINKGHIGTMQQVSCSLCPGVSSNVSSNTFYGQNNLCLQIEEL